MTIAEISRAAGCDLIFRTLLERCPLRAQSDVVHYLAGRGILADAEAAGVAALPPADEQRSLLEELLRHFAADELAAAGVLYAPTSRVLHHSRHRVLIPWRDRRGRIATVQGRALAPSTERKYSFAVGIGASEPYGAELFDELVERLGDVPVIVTESAIDALSRRKLARLDGERAIVLGLPSAQPPTKPHWAKHYFAGRDVVIALDADKSGDKGAELFVTNYCAEARTITRERLRESKDFNEALVKETSRR